MKLNGEHTAMVNGKGRDITDADLIATAATYGVPESKEVKAALNSKKIRRHTKIYRL